MKLRLHRCGPEDLEELARFSADTFTVAFEAQNDPDDFKEYVGRAFHPTKLLTELQNPLSLFYFVYAGDDLAGYFKLNTGEAQTEIREPQGLELERIYVSRAHQGKKIGQWMLEQVITLGRELGMAYLWLGVWEHNKGAIRFYQRNGFDKFGAHSFYVGKDEQTDWLMRRDLGILEPK